MLFNSTGCLLPFLIVFNLFFGRILFKTSLWLLIEAVLVLLFLLSSMITVRRIISTVGSKGRKDAIDVQGQVVDEKKDSSKLAN